MTDYDYEEYDREVEKRKAMQGEYLGDGVYAHFDGYQVVLEVSDGLAFYSKIFIEPAVMDRLKNYAERVFNPPK